jgi:hypothetical protein
MRLDVRHRDEGTPYQPARRAPGWYDLLQGLEVAFADHHVPRALPLPLRWGRETELTISAVQALDPYLKRRELFTYRSGYLPQPVVRFTGPRDGVGRLLSGYLTSFVNVSRVEPINSMSDHAAIFDNWIGVLSRLGLHARHIHLYGSLRVWRRDGVRGVTLRYRHAGTDLGDIVMLWNAADPSHLVTDLGAGLERLRWTITRRSWPEVVFGSWAHVAPLDQLDALRTAVLLVGSGILPSARGAGSATRRVLRDVPGEAARFGLSTAVRAAYRFWSLTAVDLLPWPEITSRVEREVLARR